MRWRDLLILMTAVLVAGCYQLREPVVDQGAEVQGFTGTFDLYDRGKAEPGGIWTIARRDDPARGVIYDITSDGKTMPAMAAPLWDGVRVLQLENPDRGVWIAMFLAEAEGGFDLLAYDSEGIDPLVAKHGIEVGNRNNPAKVALSAPKENILAFLRDHEPLPSKLFGKLRRK